MKEIKLTQGKTALVDDDMFEYLSQWKWFAVKGKSSFYVGRGFRKNGKRIFISMHRLIIDTPKGMLTDHINGDGLDNRKVNLRACTAVQNVCNKRMPKSNTSGFKGVQWSKDRNKWRAIIKVKNKLISLGSFTDKVKAAKVYDKAARKYFGKFCKPNFPIHS